MSRGRALGAILTDIRLSHTVFALPFALIGLLLGTGGAAPSASLLVRACAAMVLARSAAMGFNRLVDQAFDATNPRTRSRALPAGRVGRPAMVAFIAVCGAGFVGVAASLGPACLALSPLALVVVFGYSLTKRFTSLAHLFVGLALALSPPAAYLAARGTVGPDVSAVLWLGLAVLLWVAGFDIIYACQDVDHDRRTGLHSLPARLGVPRALRVACLLHAGMLGALAVTVLECGLGSLSWAGVGLVAILLLTEHSLVRGGNLARVGSAFFTVNGVVSVLFGGLMGSDLLWR